MTGKQEVMAKFSRTEIPLGQGKSHCLIPWIIALMVYLGTMALTGAVLLHRMIESWQKDFKSGFTVELQMTSDHPGQSSLEGRQKQDKLLAILRALPGVLKAEALPSNKPSATLDPFGNDIKNHRILIDVALSQDAKIDISTLEVDLRSLFSDISIKNHQVWRETILNIGHSLVGISLIIAGSIGFVSVITIAFITHSGLIIHEKVIEILRLIGAEDRFIAKQFQTYSLKMAMKGGIIGAFLSIVTYFTMKYKLQTLILDFFHPHQYETELWFVILFTPLFMMAIVMLSARMTVIFSMREE